MNYFDVQDAWMYFCEQNNKPDPWHLIKELEDEYTHYDTDCDNQGRVISWNIQVNDQTEEQKERMRELIKYRDEYMCERDVWKGQYIFENYGYVEAEKYVNLNTRFTENEPYAIAVRRWFNNLHPCESKEGQCSFICPVFQTCPYKEQGVYRNEVEITK